MIAERAVSKVGVFIESAQDIVLPQPTGNHPPSEAMRAQSLAESDLCRREPAWTLYAAS